MEHTQSHLGFPIETLTVFIVLAVIALLVDLFAHRSDKPISLLSATLWSLFWVIISLGFAAFLYIHHGAETATLFITGYALEKVLSVDNLFVIMAIFAWFKIPDIYRHKILYLGVIGAIIFRGIFVAIGTELLALGPWVEIIFAIIVAFTAIMMLKNKNDDNEIKDYSDHFANRLIRKFFPVYPKIVGHRFFLSSKTVEEELKKPENSTLKITVKKGVLYATPLLLCVAVIELSDLMFAFDSVPAIIAVSREPLIVYSAMMFAILGLRTLYFVLEALRKYLVHLEKTVVFLLFFVAFKLGLNASNHIWHFDYDIKPTWSLYVVLIGLAIGIIASLIFPERKGKPRDHTK